MSGFNAKLLDRCKKRDEKALYALYRHCYPMMKGISMRYVFDKNRVGEVVNSGFLKIVNNLDKYDVNQPFNPWASTIMVRVAIDFVRSVMRSTAKRTDLYEDMTSINGQQHFAMNDADLMFDATDLLSLLDQLPNQMRLVFNLFAVEGYSHKEIAKQLGISDGTSKWHVSKAREILRKEIKIKLNKKSSDYEPSH